MSEAVVWKIETCPFCEQKHVGTKLKVLTNLKRILKEEGLSDSKVKAICGE